MKEDKTFAFIPPGILTGMLLFSLRIGLANTLPQVFSAITRPFQHAKETGDLKLMVDDVQNLNPRTDYEVSMYVNNEKLQELAFVQFKLLALD